ncbi:MAG: efflux RND transporter permease subunit, partial [Planctomycetia bacterium]
TTIIPAVTIPVSLIGTFALMAALGFSINTLTMLGLVLAIGLVVDDAIVVVENVQRQLEENPSINPFKAAIAAMKEVTSPIIATSLVLMAVFVPVSLMPGISGRLYNQFALTIACSVGISTINSLTLSPALCSLFLKPGEQKHGWFFSKFNKGFNWVNNHYQRSLRRTVPKWKTITFFMLAVVGVTYILVKNVPGAFVPEEDQGYFMALVVRPPATALVQTTDSAEKAAAIMRDIPGVQHTVSMVGLNITSLGMQSNTGTIFCILDNWDERQTPNKKLKAIIEETVKRTKEKIPEAMVIPFNAPAIPGISATGGFEFQIQDVSSMGYKELASVTRRFVAEANKRPELEQVSSPFDDSTPGFKVDIDRNKAKMMGVAVSDVFEALQVYLGSFYINDFNLYGRVYRVYIQAKEEYREDKRDISDLYVRNKDGEMIPLGALASIERRVGPEFVSHYNIYASALVNGRPAAGYSSGQAVKAMEEVADKVLPDGMQYQWTGIIYQQQKAGILAPIIFALALVFVYLFLCAQYESWTMPTMVMLAVPLAIFGALLAQWIRGNYNDVYCQIGMVMLVGLASKNAILIVEFAANLRKEGRSIVDAAIEAAHLRLRPILMTAFAFILGVIPLVIASGAGAAARNSLGTTVFGGMLVSTILSLTVVPTLFVAIERMREKLYGRHHSFGKTVEAAEEMDKE